MIATCITIVSSSEGLMRTYGSLLNQKVDWEWNLAWAINEDVPKILAEDARVHVQPAELSSVGLTHAALLDSRHPNCGLIVELPIGAELLPNALSHIWSQLDPKKPQVLYGDAIWRTPQSLPAECPMGTGWGTYESDLFGVTYQATRSFTVNPLTLSRPEYLPGPTLAYTPMTALATAAQIPDQNGLAPRHKWLIEAYLNPQVQFVHFQQPLTFESTNPARPYLEDVLEDRFAVDLRTNYLDAMITEWGRQTGLYLLDTKSQHWSWGSLPFPAAHMEESSRFCVKSYVDLHRCPAGRQTEAWNAFHRILAPQGWLCLGLPSTADGFTTPPDSLSHWTLETIEWYTNGKLRHHMPDLEARFQVVHTRTCMENLGNRGHGESFLYLWLAAVKTSPSVQHPGVNHVY